MDAVPSRHWIFQAFAERYDLAKRFKPGRTENWVVNRFAHEITQGDVAYLWQANNEDALFGWAWVNGPVSRLPLKTPASSAEQPPPRVELLYQTRFDPPITRTEIRSQEQLAQLEVLVTGQWTNFDLDARQALALHDLLRLKGFEAPPPPEPRDSVPASPPPSDQAVTWERLSPAAQDVMGWAVASEEESPSVGTRGLLIGLLRTSHPSEADELLGYADIEHEELFDALQQVRPEKRINAAVSGPASLSSVPPLTANARRTLEAAFRLQSGPDPVDVRHLFGAILQVESSRASQALARVLEGRVPFDAVRATYTDYLQRAGTQSYADFLLGQFEGARPSTAITTDTWTDRDQLEHELYADAIARFILNAKTKAPLTIGIKAPWGAGKTSLMRMIRKRLDPQALDRPPHRREGSRLTIWEVLRKTRARTSEEAATALERDVTTHRTTIWFNAWKYQSSEQLWAGLAHAILSQVGDRLSPIDRDRLWASVQVRRLHVTQVRRGFYRYITIQLVPYLVIVPLAAIGVVVAWAIEPGLLGEASIGGAIVSAASAGTGFFRSATDEVTKAIPQLVEEPDYGSRLGFLHLVDSDMHRILEVAGATQTEPFVIFIDDLDRCSYTTVAQVIEALNVFLAGDFDNCIFVIAMEPDLVAAQIHIAYEKLFNRLGEGGSDDLGWRFLEKMVQLPLALPEPGRPQVERFLDSILLEAQTRIAQIPDDAPEVEQARAAIRSAKTTGSLEAIPEAMETVRERVHAEGNASPNLDAVLQKAARLEFEDDFSDAHARKMLMRYAGDLSGNPREIKRFINVFRFYAYVDFWRRTQGFETPGLEGAAKLARIAIGWPSLLSVLARDVARNGTRLPLLAHLEEANGHDGLWAECIALAPERVRVQLAALPELRAAITKEPRVGANVAGFL